MSPLYIENVLTPHRKTIFIKPRPFKKIGIMAGGIALAFQLGHRRSYDFDIFTSKNIPPDLSWEIRKIFGKKIKVVKDTETEFTFLTPLKFRVTFFYYPFKPLYKIIKTSSISIFDWRDIAADKAYSLGRQPMWRDYVDLYFIIKKGHGLEKIILDAQKNLVDFFQKSCS